MYLLYFLEEKLTVKMLHLYWSCKNYIKRYEERYCLKLDFWEIRVVFHVPFIVRSYIYIGLTQQYTTSYIMTGSERQKWEKPGDKGEIPIQARIRGTTFFFIIGTMHNSYMDMSTFHFSLYFTVRYQVLWYQDENLKTGKLTV
jgi:hypothetical protein